ncbi:hypothetical protein E2562_000566 [Oryza meyeriana var. granulata]|uniref:Uncharacterized protein n=1 Tax=Oryza meyeriana var. granulata TaxID=110450 RepID=A0A6G1DW72_9ORYZ|nr:hypothetical protein E2562_000566 [Oryza meyeriana var. granulata]
MAPSLPAFDSSYTVRLLPPLRFSAPRSASVPPRDAKLLLGSMCGGRRRGGAGGQIYGSTNAAESPTPPAPAPPLFSGHFRRSTLSDCRAPYSSYSGGDDATRPPRHLVLRRRVTRP